MEARGWQVPAEMSPRKKKKNGSNRCDGFDHEEDYGVIGECGRPSIDTKITKKKNFFFNFRKTSYTWEEVNHGSAVKYIYIVKKQNAMMIYLMNIWQKYIGRIYRRNKRAKILILGLTKEGSCER